MVDDRLVTPEAVQLDLETATIATRSLGRLLDVLLQVAVVLLVVGAVGQVLQDTAGLTVALLTVFVVRVSYAPWLETRYGATLGQRALGLRIRSLDGGPIRLRQALVRMAVGLFEVDATSGLVALLVSAVRRDGRRLGDLAAGTVAVSVRTAHGEAQPLSLTCPPALVGWAVGIDPAGVDTARRAALRRYLVRAGSLAPEARARVARPLAERLVADLGLSWPPGAVAHDVLTAIAATVREHGEGTAPVGDLAQGDPPAGPPSGFHAPG